MKKLITISALLAITACSNTEKEVKPIIKDIKELVFASGEIEWDDSYNLVAQTDGTLLEAKFEIGEKLTKGQIIAVIDNQNNSINTATANEQLAISKENLTSQSPALQQLQNNITIAENKYSQDQIQAARYQRLFELNSVAKVEYENMKLAAENSLAAVIALKKQALLLEQQSRQQFINSKGQWQNNKVIEQYNKIIVLESGTIIKKLKSTGDFVRKGDVIATLANEKIIQAVLYIDETSIDKIKIGQPAYIQLNTDKSKIYNAKINEIEVAFNIQTQSFKCKAKFEDTIKYALFGTQLEANILVGEKQKAMLIPRSYMGYGNSVNIKDKDEKTIIKTGIVSIKYVEVLEGIDTSTILVPIQP